MLFVQCNLKRDKKTTKNKRKHAFAVGIVVVIRGTLTAIGCSIESVVTSAISIAITVSIAVAHCSITI